MSTKNVSGLDAVSNTYVNKYVASIVLTQRLDYETTPSYSFQLRVSLTSSYLMFCFDFFMVFTLFSKHFFFAVSTDHALLSMRKRAHSGKNTPCCKCQTHQYYACWILKQISWMLVCECNDRPKWSVGKNTNKGELHVVKP